MKKFLIKISKKETEKISSKKESPKKESLKEALTLEEELEPESITVKNLTTTSKVGRKKLLETLEQKASLQKEIEQPIDVETIPSLEPIFEKEESNKETISSSSKKLSKPPSLKSFKIVTKKSNIEE